MEVTTTKCDICGKLETTDEYHPPGWYSLSREGDREEDFWARSRDICHECATKMGLPQICIKYKPDK
jgi:hypothetical protein